jgi:tryptophan 2,3-dioxygenase
MSSKYATTHYHQYLHLDKVLEAQQLKSAADGKPAHDEMLFIIIHQAYELWFKQILHELGSVVDIMDDPYVDERALHKVEHRLNRVVEIQQLLIQQIRVLETMSPLEFLSFRDYLFPASGFQSFQFRLVETLMGLRSEDRISYTSQPFYKSLEPQQQEQLQALMQKPSLFDAVQQWLERMPFTSFGGFHFMEHYGHAVAAMFDKEKKQIQASDFINDEEKALRINILAASEKYFQRILSETAYAEATAAGETRLSYKATVSALFIHLYHEEPILSNPYQLLMKLVDIDELFTTWRYRHAQMVMRMLGRKMGTGGSSGHDYLKETAAKHQVFRDFHNVSTLLVPAYNIPALPAELKKQMSFHFGGNE